MITKYNTTLFILCFGCLLFTFQSTAQVFNNLDYECLETPLVFYTPNQGNVHINCNEGIMTMDTLDDPCYDFYEEDGNILKTWYYLQTNTNGTNNLYFDSVRMHHDSEFSGELVKYFELHRSGFWFSFLYAGNPVHKLSFRVSDLSGGGINFGKDLSIGAEFYTDFDELASQNIEGLSIDYTDDILTIEGDLERLYIGGDHLYIANLLINEIPTSLTTLEQFDLKIYPNPTTGTINIDGKGLPGSEIQIIDVNGKVVLSENITSEKWQKDITSYPSGIFWIRVWNDKKMVWSKAITKH